MQRKGQVRTLKEYKQARGTHILLSTEKGLRQDTERIQAGKVHSHSVKCRERVKSGLKEYKQARGTHQLLSAEKGSSQDTERIQAGKGHSPTVECRERVKLKH